MTRLDPRPLIRSVFASSFFRNILVVMTGSSIAQGISYLLSPIVSRLFTAADFGLFGSFNAVFGIIGSLITLDFSQAIMLPKEKHRALNLFVLSCLCTLAISALCAVFSLFFPSVLKGLMKTDSSWFLVFLVFALLVYGFNQSVQAWAVRSKAFKHTSASQVIRSVSSSGLRIGLGTAKTGGLGLVVSMILADLAATCNIARVLIPDLKAMKKEIGGRLIKALAWEYRDFPMYSASQNFVNALSNGLPVLLLTHFYGIAVAGAYTFAMSVLQAPMSLITSALRQVLFQRASETQNQGGRIAPLYIKTTAGLFLLMLIPSLVLVIWGPQLFSWIFGKRWLLAGAMSRSLMIWLGIVFCNVPAVLFARLVRIQRFVFFYELVLLAGRTGALVVGGLLLSPVGTITAFALIGAVMNAYLIFSVGRTIVRREKAAVRLDLKDLFNI